MGEKIDLFIALSLDLIVHFSTSTWNNIQPLLPF